MDEERTDYEIFEIAEPVGLPLEDLILLLIPSREPVEMECLDQERMNCVRPEMD